MVAAGHRPANWSRAAGAGADRRGRVVLGSIMFQMQWNAALPAQQAHTNYYFAGMSTVRRRSPPSTLPARPLRGPRFARAPRSADTRGRVLCVMCCRPCQASDPAYRDDPSRITGKKHMVSSHSAGEE